LVILLVMLQSLLVIYQNILLYILLLLDGELLIMCQLCINYDSNTHVRCERVAADGDIEHYWSQAYEGSVFISRCGCRRLLLQLLMILLSVGFHRLIALTGAISCCILGVCISLSANRCLWTDKPPGWRGWDQTVMSVTVIIGHQYASLTAQETVPQGYN